MFLSTVVTLAALCVAPALAYVECNVLDYGAKADNSTDLGPAITSAYNNCVKGKTTGTPGDVLLYIPSGNYRLASTVLLDDAADFEFHLAGYIYLPFDGKLTGTMIGFENCNNILFDGPGRIYGNGYWWRQNGDLSAYPSRPRLLRFQNCNNVELTQVELFNAPMFHVTIIGDNNVVHDMSVRADHIGETDAFDISGDNNFVHDVSVENGDECVTVKTPTNGFIAQNIECIYTAGCNIGSFGSANTAVAINNVTFSGVTISNSDAGTMIKSYPNNKGYVKNVKFEGFTLSKAAYPIYISVFWEGGTSDTGSLEISDISYSGFTGTGTPTRPAVLLDCNKAAHCTDITFSGIDITSAKANSFTNACGSGLSGLSSC